MTFAVQSHLCSAAVEDPVDTGSENGRHSDYYYILLLLLLQRVVVTERPALGLKFNELPGDVVATSLRQNSQHRPSGLVEVNAPRQRTPEGAAGPLDEVSHLKHGQTDAAILACETVVSHAQVQLVTVRI